MALNDILTRAEKTDFTDFFVYGAKADGEEGRILAQKLSKLFLYRPTTEPVVLVDTITIDLLELSQGMFEPRKSTADLSIDTDFTLSFTNVTDSDLLSLVFSLTGTRIITFPADVICTIASSIGEFDDILKTLTLSAGTDDIIEMQLLRYKSDSKWLLKVSEVKV